MRLEALLTAANGAASATAGAVIVFGETGEGLALLAISGVCSVISAMYYRAHDDEGAGRDIVVTVLMPFVAGAIFAQPLAQFLAVEAKAKFDVMLAPIASYGVAGCATGFILTPLARAAVSGKLKNIGAAIEAALKAVKGGKQ